MNSYQIERHESPATPPRNALQDIGFGQWAEAKRVGSWRPEDSPVLIFAAANGERVIFHNKGCSTSHCSQEFLLENFHADELLPTGTIVTITI